MGLSSRLVRRGYLLPITLMAAAALFLFAISFLKFVNAEAQAARHLVFSVSARQAAVAGRTEAMSKLQKDNAWTGTLDWTELKEAGADYYLTFDSKSGSPYSTSNVGSTQLKTGWNGTQVPPGFVHLVALGRCGPVTQRSEALLSPPGSVILEENFESGPGLWTNLVGPAASASGVLSVGGGASSTTTGTAPVVTTVTTVNHPGNSNPQGHAYGHTSTQTVVVSGGTSSGPVSSESQLLVHQDARAEQFEAEFSARPEAGGGAASFYFRSLVENGQVVEGLRLVMDPSGGEIRIEQIQGGKVSVLQSTPADLAATTTGTGTTTTTTTTTTVVHPGNSNPQGHAYGHTQTTGGVTVTGTSGSGGTVPFSLYKITVVNGQLTVARDGTELFSLTEPSSNTPGLERFGFGTALNSGLEVDTLVIKTLESRLVSAWTAAYTGGNK